MSVPGQKRKGSHRANVVRSTTNNGHSSVELSLPHGAGVGSNGCKVRGAKVDDLTRSMKSAQRQSGRNERKVMKPGPHIWFGFGLGAEHPKTSVN